MDSTNNLQKVLLITGASSGIGEATAKIFAKDKSFITYATARKLESIKHLEILGCRTLVLDVNSEESMQTAISQINSESNGVDILVNNAAYAQNGVLEEVAIQDIKAQFDTNLFGLIRMCQLVLPNMRNKKQGRIINIGSVGGEFTMPGASVYHASKYALESISDGLRCEVKQFGIKVCLIKPGGVRSKFVDSIKYPEPIEGDSYHEFRSKFKTMTDKIFDFDNNSYGILTPEQVAKVIYNAAIVKSPKARYSVGMLGTIIPLMKKFSPDGIWDKLMLGQMDMK